MEFDAGEEQRRKQREYKRKYHAANKAKLNKRCKDWYRSNKTKVLDYRLRKTYGISLEQRDALFASQDNACAVCRSKEPGSKRGWHVDHCHTSGEVRGILCCGCNVLLGHARDNPDILAAGIRYLADTRQSDGPICH